MLSFLPLDVLDEIWDLIESVSEGFPVWETPVHLAVSGGVIDGVFLRCPFSH